MSEAEKRKYRLCFTGHRPEKLHSNETAVCTVLSNAIDAAISDGYRTFITGMARGVDIWAAEIVLARKAVNTEIRLICALPHPDFEKRWSAHWQERYNAILQQADLVKTICPEFSMASYQTRNEWMVDHSARVIAIYNGSSGGTAKTITYAEKHGVEVWRYDA
jgi:uncharacterized phage-like protein YoqJ